MGFDRPRRVHEVPDALRRRRAERRQAAEREEPSAPVMFLGSPDGDHGLGREDFLSWCRATGVADHVRRQGLAMIGRREGATEYPDSGARQYRNPDLTTMLGRMQPPPRPRLGDAVALLREALAGGPKDVTDLVERARAEGIRWRVMERAKAALGIEAQRKGGLGKAGKWDLAASCGGRC